MDKKIIILGSGMTGTVLEALSLKDPPSIVIVGKPDAETVKTIQDTFPGHIIVHEDVQPIELAVIPPDLSSIINKAIDYDPILYEENKNYINGKKKIPRRKKRK